MDETAAEEDGATTIEEDFMSGATEFSTGNPYIVGHKSKPVKRGAANQLKSYNGDLRK